MRKTGHADELPGALLNDLIDKLVPLVTAAESDAARYPVARTLARRIRELVATLQEGPSARLLEARCHDLHEWIEHELDADVSAGLRTTADTVARLVDEAAHAIVSWRAARDGKEEEADEHEDHDPAQRSEAHYNRQVTGLRAQRGSVGLELDRGAQTATSADDAVAAARTTPDKLYAEVDRIINHPFESTWWRAPMKTWLEAHRREVSQWILDRNRGRIHSH